MILKPKIEIPEEYKGGILEWDKDRETYKVSGTREAMYTMFLAAAEAVLVKGIADAHDLIHAVMVMDKHMKVGQHDAEEGTVN